MTCETCKHWDLTGDRLKGPLNYVDRPAGYGFCVLTEEHEGKFQASAEAFAMDSSEYSACLVTSPRFGCNQFEPK